VVECEHDFGEIVALHKGRKWHKNKICTHIYVDVSVFWQPHSILMGTVSVVNSRWQTCCSINIVICDLINMKFIIFITSLWQNSLLLAECGWSYIHICLFEKLSLTTLDIQSYDTVQWLW